MRAEQVSMVDMRFVEPELLGQRLAWGRLLLLDYEYSFYSPEGELCYGGTLVGRGRGTGFALGTEWSFYASELVPI